VCATKPLRELAQGMHLCEVRGGLVYYGLYSYRINSVDYFAGLSFVVLHHLDSAGLPAGEFSAVAGVFNQARSTRPSILLRAGRFRRFTIQRQHFSHRYRTKLQSSWSLDQMFEQYEVVRQRMNVGSFVDVAADAQPMGFVVVPIL
jgi:hypothetical protein